MFWRNFGRTLPRLKAGVAWSKFWEPDWLSGGCQWKILHCLGAEWSAQFYDEEEEEDGDDAKLYFQSEMTPFPPFKCLKQIIPICVSFPQEKNKMTLNLVVSFPLLSCHLSVPNSPHMHEMTDLRYKAEKSKRCHRFLLYASLFTKYCFHFSTAINK